MKKLIVDDAKCIGCGACVQIDKEHFDFNDEGLSHVMSNNNLESNNLQEAIDSCPTSAISIEDGCNCDEECDCDDECNCDSECHCECCNCEN